MLRLPSDFTIIVNNLNELEKVLLILTTYSHLLNCHRKNIKGQLELVNDVIWSSNKNNKMKICIINNVLKLCQPTKTSIGVEYTAKTFIETF